jgi:CheY-like chemotaxis protein
LDFTVERFPDLPRYVTIDQGKLRQVLINLIGNAIKYTKTGGVIFRAMVAKKETLDRALLGFEVEDTGPGIREEDRERIFAPFAQLGEQPPTEAGTGLGLAICKQYVELMGGAIRVASAPVKGSIFHFEIPVAVLPDEAIPTEPQRGRVIGLAEGQPRYRLLIAEDHPESRLMLHKMLAPLGFDLREAVNGKEAVALFEEWHPHLIWMDIRMPVINGLEATRFIKATEAGTGIKIIALTAHALEEEQREIMAAGCDDFMSKPYKYEEIIDALTKNLGVRFVYEEETTSSAAAAAQQPDTASLAALPKGLMDALEHALGRLDIGGVDRTIGDIRAHDSSLGDALAAMAKDFQYSNILQLIGTARSDIGPEDQS